MNIKELKAARAELIELTGKHEYVPAASPWAIAARVISLMDALLGHSAASAVAVSTTREEQ